MKGLQVINAPSLAKLTSIRLGGTAIADVQVDDLDGLESLPEVLRRLGGRPVVLGRGSNILAGEGELPLVLIRAGRDFADNQEELLREYDDRALFAAGGGLRLPVLVSRLTRAGYAGLAGLVGIPGSVGGAVSMNAGSFGMDIKGCLHAATIFSPRLGLVKKAAAELSLAYRHFSVPELDAVAAASTDANRKTGKERDDWFMVLRAEFLCRKAEAALLLEEMEGFRRAKVEGQPVGALSAGCVFKNHPAGPAGKLLDESGMKGKKLGGMMFSELHANFLINTGSGTSAQAFELIDEARRAVGRRFGAELELEVRVWP